MATKLKKMNLTSVDLVRSGANQAADICLFKSADHAEAPEQPTERETNILKRFLKWLTENPVDDEYEPENPVEKADEEPDTATIYKNAITESLQSIAADASLSTEEKNSLIEKSIGQYHDAMLDLLNAPDVADFHDEDMEKSDSEDEVEKINPYHGTDDIDEIEEV